jgi:hypothetical protein
MNDGRQDHFHQYWNNHRHPNHFYEHLGHRMNDYDQMNLGKKGKWG